MKIDFVTVTYGMEIPLLRLQARSMRLFLDRGIVGSIVVVINEDDPGETRERILRDVLPEYGDLSGLVRIVAVGDIFSDRTRASGWKRQQTIKLMAATLPGEDHYVVLDSKNHFIKPVSLSRFISADGRMISMRHRSHGERHYRLVKVLEYFGAGNVLLNSLMPITTPFVLPRREVAEMIRYIEAREGVGFPAFFHSAGPDVTEFFLFYAYLIMRYGTVENLYLMGDPFVAILWEGTPVGIRLARTLDKALKDDSVYCLSLHVKRARVINTADASVLSQAWAELGIFGSRSEGLRYIETYQAELNPANASVSV